MAEGDRPDDMPPGGKSDKPRRHPPVIELEATEVGAESNASKPKPEAASSAQPKKPETGSSTAGLGFKPASMRLPLIAGGIGAAAGAVALYFAFPYFAPAPAPSDPALAREVATLSARIEAMSKQAPVSPDANALGQRIDKLTSAVAEAEKRLSAAETRPAGSPPASSADTALDNVSKELRDALAELKKLGGQTEQSAVTSAIESMSAKIEALDTRVTSLAATNKASADAGIAKEIITLNTLSAAIQSGKPFVQELAATRTVLGDRAAPLEFLNPASVKGIPTVTVLSDQFTSLAPQLLRKDSGEGFFGRLYSNATNLVQVRRIGELQGDDAEAVVARIETYLSRGDLAAALSESAKLPDAAKAKAVQWIEEANRRRAAELAVKTLVDSVLLAPGQPKS